MNSGLTSHQQRGHTETGPRFKVSSERPEKRGIDLATPGLVVQRVIHYTTAAPKQIKKGVICVQILSEIHITEHGRFHFQGRTAFYTPVLVPPSRHMMSK